MSLVWRCLKKDERVFSFTVLLNYTVYVSRLKAVQARRTSTTMHCKNNLPSSDLNMLLTCISYNICSVCKHWPYTLLDITDFNELGREADHWLPLRVGVKNELSHTAIPPDAFMACTRTTLLSSLSSVIQIFTF